MTIELFSADKANPGLQARIESFRTRLGGRLKLGLRAEFTRYGLSRDLSRPISMPAAKIPISVRPLRDPDLPALFSTTSADANERLLIAWREAFINKGAHRGYVAVDERKGAPCYVQWLCGPDENKFLERVGGFPKLERHQALLENAYTPIHYRGLGIMSEAMALIAERATSLGASEVITFVDHDNVPSLKGCQRAGFEPSLLHHRTRFGFGLVTFDRFTPLAAEDPRRSQQF